LLIWFLFLEEDENRQIKSGNLVILYLGNLVILYKIFVNKQQQQKE
jgi:hypothetical protein